MPYGRNVKRSLTSTGRHGELSRERRDAFSREEKAAGEAPTAQRTEVRKISS